MSRYFSAQTGAVAIASGSTEYPLVVTSGQNGTRIAEFSISFDGNAATDDKPLCKLVRVASVTGGTSLTPVAVNDENGNASVTTAVYDATSVGSIEKTTWAEYVHPQGGYTYRPGVRMASGEIWALVVTTGSQGHNCVARIVTEE